MKLLSSFQQHVSLITLADGFERSRQTDSQIEGKHMLEIEHTHPSHKLFHLKGTEQMGWARKPMIGEVVKVSTVDIEITERSSIC